MTLLPGFNVVQIGGGSAAAVCGRLMADVGAQVTCIDPEDGTTLLAYLNQGKLIAVDAVERRERLRGGAFYRAGGTAKGLGRGPL